MTANGQADTGRFSYPKRHSCGNLEPFMNLKAERLKQLHLFFQSAKGQFYLKAELDALLKTSASLRGNQFLLIGASNFYPLTQWGYFLQYHHHPLEEIEKKLPFPDQSFDAILMPHLMYLVEKPALMLTEIQRLLRPEGTFITTSRYKNAPLVRAKKNLYLSGFENLKVHPIYTKTWQRYVPLLRPGYVLKASKKQLGMTLVKTILSSSLNLYPLKGKLVTPARSSYGKVC